MLLQNTSTKPYHDDFIGFLKNNTEISILINQVHAQPKKETMQQYKDASDACLFVSYLE